VSPSDQAYERITTEIARECERLSPAERTALLRSLEEWVVNELGE